MNPKKALATEADYEDAFKRVEELWAAETPEFWALISAIEAYEEEHYPIPREKPNVQIS